MQLPKEASEWRKTLQGYLLCVLVKNMVVIFLIIYTKTIRFVFLGSCRDLITADLINNCHEYDDKEEKCNICTTGYTGYKCDSKLCVYVLFRL